MSEEEIYLRTEAHFDAAHNLVNYEGKCANMHGHRWVVKAEFGPFYEEELDAAGIALDFKDVKRDLNKLVEKYDHTYLNNYFDLPSAEKIALQLFRSLKQLYPTYLYAIEVFESPESKCLVKSRREHGS